MSKDKAYVISSGHYSDYQVHAVVNGKRKEAEALAARANASDGDSWRDDYRVEEMPVVQPDVQRVMTLHLSTTIWDNGTLGANDPKPHKRAEWPFDATCDLHPVRHHWVRAPIHNGKGGRLETWGTDHERVRKVHADLLAALRSDDALRARGWFSR